MLTEEKMNSIGARVKEQANGFKVPNAQLARDADALLTEAMRARHAEASALAQRDKALTRVAAVEEAVKNGANLEALFGSLFGKK